LKVVERWAVAALLAGKVPELGEKVVIVLSGGNVDFTTLIEVARDRYPYQEAK